MGAKWRKCGFARTKREGSKCFGASPPVSPPFSHSFLTKTVHLNLQFSPRLIPGFYLGFIVWGRSPLQVAEDDEFPRGGPGVCPPEMFWNDSVLLRCNLVHFETQFWEMLRCVHWPRRVWMIFRCSYLYTVMITILFGGEPGHLGGGSSYPSNTLDRTLKCDDDENTMATATATATGTPKTETKQNLCTCITLFCKFLCRPSTTTTSNG